jgi:tetratricopeptide (TPR) repeat protein
MRSLCRFVRGIARCLVLGCTILLAGCDLAGLATLIHHDIAASNALMNATNRARELYAQGRYEQAIPFAEKALTFSENEFGPRHSEVVLDLNSLALLYWQLGRYREAEPLYRRALAIREKALGSEHPDVATTLGNLANLYSDTDQQRFNTLQYPTRLTCSQCYSKCLPHLWAMYTVEILRIDFTLFDLQINKYGPFFL